MIYFNTFLEEFYVFDAEGEWFTDKLENKNLSLDVRFNEKKNGSMLLEQFEYISLIFFLIIFY